jgi:hypothetical protein
VDQVGQRFVSDLCRGKRMRNAATCHWRLRRSVSLTCHSSSTSGFQSLPGNDTLSLGTMSERTTHSRPIGEPSSWNYACVALSECQRRLRH